METKKRFRGYILVTLIVFLLVWTSGTVAFSYNERPGEECFFPEGRENYTFSGITRLDGNNFYYYEVKDEAALKEKLSQLKLCEISSDISSFSDEAPLMIFYNDPSGINFNIVIHERYIVWGDTYNPGRRNVSYIGNADLSGIMELLTPVESDDFGFLVPEVTLDMGNGHLENAAYRFLSAEGHDFAEDPEPMGSCVFDTDSSCMDIVISAEGSVPVSVSAELYDDRSEPPVYVSAGETHIELPKGELFGVITVTFHQPDPEGYFTMEYTFDVTVR